MQQQRAHRWMPAQQYFNLQYHFASVSNLNGYNHQLFFPLYWFDFADAGFVYMLMVSCVAVWAPGDMSVNVQFLYVINDLWLLSFVELNLL